MLLSTIILQAAGAAVWGKVAGAAGAAVAALAAAWGIGKIGQSAMASIARHHRCTCRGCLPFRNHCLPHGDRNVKTADHESDAA